MEQKIKQEITRLGTPATYPRNLKWFFTLFLWFALCSTTLANGITQGSDDKQTTFSQKSAKRAGPMPVDPVTIGGMRIEAVHWAQDSELFQNGGYLAAYDLASGTQRWMLQVYCTDYDPRRERDVQDVFITSLRLLPDGKLMVADELEREFLVNPETRSVQRH